ncbi:MAG: hypothetical protein FD165_2773 [Gammaproteobacteria bacterium]|nr:MAG: hypothetical protein FD165_2773 [Gammaproteobacteria bacterium]
MRKVAVPRRLTFAATVLALVAVLPAPTFAADEKSGNLWPWSSQNAKEPPKVQPYEVPTFGAKRNFREAPAQWQKAPKIDGDAVFRMVVACYPNKSRWNLDVDLQAAVRNQNMVDVTGTVIGQHTVGIVARMPLYSATEMDREREREYKRRTDTAGKVAEFVGQIAARNQALRALAISAAMESRAQIRVNEGIADAEEQLKYLDKVAGAEKDLITAEAKAMDARLSLVAMCRDEEADAVNAYLTDLAHLPAAAKP